MVGLMLNELQPNRIHSNLFTFPKAFKLGISLCFPVRLLLMNMGK
ncbi:Uncharacterised protein [Bacillus freudenreichii]|nr:Uncharacterised protein [Bacillus freudenreichii]